MRTLTSSLLLVTLVATVGLGWLFDRVYIGYIIAEKPQNIDTVKLVEQLGFELTATLNKLPNRHQFINAWTSHHGHQLSIVSVEDFPLPKPLREDLKSGIALLLESDNDLAFHFYLQNSDELLILKSPLSNFKAADRSLDYIFTIFFYLGLLILFLLWVYPLVRQLLSLRKAARSFGQGDFSQRIAVSSVSYIRDIQMEFNHMAKRIEDLVGDVKLLSTGVSHDLRTPLAKIRFGIDTLEEEEDPKLRRLFHKKISANVDEMTSLVGTLLSYARLDQAMLELKREPVELSGLLEHCIQNQTTSEVAIRFDRPDSDVIVTGDRRYLLMLVNNLLQNAIVYGQGQVLIKLEVLQDKVKLVVADNGEGITIEQRSKVFKPFVRGENRQKQIKGHGIGLAIVKRIADWHQGDIQIAQSEELSGAQFTLVLAARAKSN